MAFRTYRPATWADVQAGDRIRTTSGAEFIVQSRSGAEMTMEPRNELNRPGPPVTGTPRPDGPVEILREIEPAPPAPQPRERLQSELDALAMTTAAALVQLRLSATVLAEHLDGQPLALGPAQGMDVEHLRAHLLAYHGEAGGPGTSGAGLVAAHALCHSADDRDGEPADVPHEHLPF